MNPIRPVATHLPIGRLCVVFFFVFSLLLSGCLLAPSAGKKRDFALPDAEARQAGALALYAKGLLYESGESSDTNTAKEAALTAFRQALQLDPDNRRPLSALLSNLADRERFSDALDAAEAFLQRHPDDLDLRFEAARFADAADRPAEAARHCAVILAAQPDNRELAQALIRLQFQAGREEDALALIRAQHARFKDASSSALPVHWAVHFTREAKNPARALKCFALALDQRTNAAERAALTTLAAECQLELGQTNAAFATLRQACRENPDSTSPLLRLGALWALRPNATNRLEQLARREPGSETARLVLAAAYQALDNRPAAIAALDAVKARRLRAGYFSGEGFYLWLGSLLEAEKDRAGAERLLRDALATHPGSHEIKNFLAYMWAEQGVRLDEADRLVTEALQSAPSNAAYLDTKGWVLFKKTRHFDALQFLLKAADLDRNEPVILDHTGDVLLAVGRSAEAVVFWTRSHEIEPAPAVADKLRKHGVTPTRLP